MPRGTSPLTDPEVAQLRHDVDDMRGELGQVKDAINRVEKIVQTGSLPSCQVEGVRIAQMRIELDALTAVIKGSNNRPGLDILVDRLIQQMTIVQWIGGALVLILLGEAVARLLKLI